MIVVRLSDGSEEIAVPSGIDRLSIDVGESGDLFVDGIIIADDIFRRRIRVYARGYWMAAEMRP